MTMIPLYAQLLILTILAISSARVFSIRQTRLDSLVMFIPFALFVLFIESIAWGLSVNEIILFNLIILASIVNYKSFFRFINHLFVDSYSALYTISSLLLFLIIIATAVLFIAFKPVYLKEDKLQIKTETKYLSGTFNTGFSESDETLQTKNLKLTVYTPDANKGNYQNDYAVIFVPDKRARFSSYDPFLKLLAKSGFKVYAGDFGFSTVPSSKKVNINFLRQHELFMKSKKAGGAYYSAAENNYYLDVYAKEMEVIAKIADKNEPVAKKLIIVADEGPALAASKIISTPRQIVMCHNISLISEYKTPGYGFIQQSDPLLAKFSFNLDRDKKGYYPGYVVMKIKSAIEAYEKAQFEELNGDVQ